jgi:hypothetical protein
MNDQIEQEKKDGEIPDEEEEPEIWLKTKLL